MRYYVITAKIVKQVDGNMQEREKKKVAFVNNQRENHFDCLGIIGQRNIAEDL